MLQVVTAALGLQIAPLANTGVAQRATVSMAERVGPAPEEITKAQRKNLGCPDYTEEQKNTWKTSDIDINEEYLKIQGHPVMEAWEHPYG